VWKLIDAQASKSKCRSFQPCKRQGLSPCHIKRALNQDHKKRTENAGDEIEQNLQAGRLKTAWKILLQQTWYKHTGDLPERLRTRLDLRKVTTEYKVL
jgi:hypothetical protein